MLNKYIFSDNGTLSDKTSALEDYYTGSSALTVVAAEDYLYIGSKLPFTRKFFKVTTANATAAVLTAHYWDGSTWRATASLIDDTAVAGATLGVSGYVAWEADKRYAWLADDTSINETTRVTGLGTVTLYDMYWLRLTFSGAATPTLSWAGDLFASDADLGSEYPDLNRTAVKTAYEAGKTTWEDQRRVASRLVSQDLKRFKIADGSQLVLSLDALALATVSKTAEIIFNGLKGFDDQAKAANAEYRKRIDRQVFVVDVNQNGRADGPETAAVRVTRLHR